MQIGHCKVKQFLTHWIVTWFNETRVPLDSRQTSPKLIIGHLTDVSFIIVFDLLGILERTCIQIAVWKYEHQELNLLLARGTNKTGLNRDPLEHIFRVRWINLSITIIIIDLRFENNFFRTLAEIELLKFCHGCRLVLNRVCERENWLLKYFFDFKIAAEWVRV